MIKFDSSKYHKTRDGGVYLKYEDIEMMTEQIIIDYDESLLRYPRAIEYDDFIEGYLGATLMYQDIYTPDPDDVILGCTVFNNQAVPIFDRESMRKSYVNCRPGTIILDNSLIQGERKIQENISGLHEGGHYWLHKEQFAEIEGQKSLNDFNGTICCRRGDIESSGGLEKSRLNNAEMWREWQANIFAVTIALPKKSLDIAVRELFKKYGIDTDVLIVDAGFGYRYIADKTIPGELSEIYNMSMQSIKYRLEKTGFYTTKKKYEEEHSNAQMSIFDFIKKESISSYSK